MGAAVVGDTLRIAYNAFVGNIAGAGGGLYLASQSGPRAVVEHNLFLGNAGMPVENNEFWGNPPLSGRGGAIYVEFISPVVIAHNTFYGNRVETDHNPFREDPAGAAIYSWGPRSYIGSNNFVRNPGADALYFMASNTSLIHNLMHANVDGDYGGAPPYVVGEIRGDPLFFAPGYGDFRLRPGSPAIGAADPDPPAEIEQPMADVGAYPFDADDPALLYVVPRSARRPAGETLLLKVLIANLGANPLQPRSTPSLSPSATPSHSGRASRPCAWRAISPGPARSSCRSRSDCHPATMY